MKKTFTQSMSWLHTWGGLLLGWLLVPIFYTGSLAVFEPEISRWMRPELHSANVSALPAPAAAALAEARLQLVGQGAESWRIKLPEARDPTLEIGWGAPRKMSKEYLDPLSGNVLPVRATEGGHFFTHFHAELDAEKTGRIIVCLAGLVMLAALITGIVVHKKIFQDFFTFRPHASAQRSWLDAHNVLGVLGLPFLLVITYTGVVILVDSYLPAATRHLYGEKSRARSEVVQSFERKPLGQPAVQRPLAELTASAEQQLGTGRVGSITIRAPGDANASVRFSRQVDDRLAAIADHVTFAGSDGRVLGLQDSWNPMAYAFRTQVGLHVVHFGGHTAQILYFLGGLAGTAMMGVGLVLFTLKRRKRSGGEFGRATPRAYAVIEALNLAATSGIVIASAAYLWSNRLLPAGGADRAEHEVLAFFGVWAATLLHALHGTWRDAAGAAPPRPSRAWYRQTALAALLYLLLPALDYLLTAPGSELPTPFSDPIVAGVNGVALLLGSLFALLAWRLRRAVQDAPPARHPLSQISEETP